MTRPAPQFSVRFASDADDMRAAARLRYDVFVREMGGDGPMVDHAVKEERDRFDRVCTQMLLVDGSRAAGDQVVGLYRLMDTDGADQTGFYSAGEFDLTPLLRSGRRLLELGRSCLHADYRGGDAMFHLWQGLAAHVAAEGAEILFGVASFHGTDMAALAGPLSLLQHEHLAPEPLRVQALRPAGFDPGPPVGPDRTAALRAMPALIKAYLRLGGVVGQGAHRDLDFNTTDVCLILDTAALRERTARIYSRPRDIR